MASSVHRAATHDKVVNIRTSQERCNLIDRAAKVVGKTRSDFIMDLAEREATDILLDQNAIYLDDEAYDRFVELLDNPRPPTDTLRRLLQTKARWE